MATLSLQRSKQLAEREGWLVAVVEKWVMGANIRVDMFGFADLLCIRPGQKGSMAIQACGEDIQSHITKILEGWTSDKGKVYPPNTCIKTWLECGNTFFIWAWRKRGARGERKTWQLRQIEFIIKDGIVTPYEIPTKAEGTD